MRDYLGYEILKDENGYWYSKNTSGERFPTEGWSRSVQDLKDLIEEDAKGE